MYEADESIFPTKPELRAEDTKSNISKFLLSMVLFVALFLTLFSENYQFVIEVIIILIIHEMGHFLMMKYYGYQSMNMIFVPFLGTLSKNESKRISQKHKSIVSLMGPMPGIFLGLVVLVYFIYNPENELLLEVSLLLLCINVANLIPIDPLDGGHLLETLYFPNNDQVKMYFTLISSLLVIALGFYLDFFILMLFGFFMAFKVRGFQKNQKIHDNLENIDFNYKQSYQELSDKEYWTIRRVFLESNPKIRDIIPNEMELWENEKLLVEQVRQLLRSEVIVDLNLGKRIVFTLLYLALIIVPLLLIFENWPMIEAFLFNDGL